MTYERDFRVLVFHIAERLTSSDRDSLRYIYGLPEEEREGSSAGLDVLKNLHQQGIYSSAEQLSNVLKTARREDLAKLAEDFNAKYAVAGCVDPGHHSPTQLRGKCEADIAQANSVASELQNIRGFITRNGLSEEALGRICHQLEEMEKVFQVLLGRCEIMHRCCVAAAADRPKHSRSDETRAQDETSRQQLCHALRGASPDGKVKIFIPVVHNRTRSDDNRPRSAPAPPSYIQLQSPTPCSAVSADNIMQYPASKDHMKHRNYLPDTLPVPSHTITSYTNAVAWCRTNHHNPISITRVFSNSDTDVRRRRPHVPVKPDWIRRASSVENILEVASSKYHFQRDTGLEDSGYYSKSCSLGNLSS